MISGKLSKIWKLHSFDESDGNDENGECWESMRVTRVEVLALTAGELLVPFSQSEAKNLLNFTLPDHVSPHSDFAKCCASHRSGKEPQLGFTHFQFDGNKSFCTYWRTCKWQLKRRAAAIEQAPSSAIWLWLKLKPKTEVRLSDCACKSQSVATVATYHATAVAYRYLPLAPRHHSSCTCVTGSTLTPI